MRDLKKIKRFVERELDIKNIEVKSRKRHIAYARALYCAIAKKNTTRSLCEIGKVINRDHSSALYNIYTLHEKSIKKNEKYKDLFIRYALQNKNELNESFVVNHNNKTISDLVKDIEKKDKLISELQEIKKTKDKDLMWFFDNYKDLSWEDKITVIERNKTHFKVMKALKNNKRR